MLSGFDSNEAGIPWTSDFSSSHPNPENWDVHENFHRPHGGLGGQTPYDRLRQKTAEASA